MLVLASELSSPQDTIDIDKGRIAIDGVDTRIIEEMKKIKVILSRYSESAGAAYLTAAIQGNAWKYVSLLYPISAGLANEDENRDSTWDIWDEDYTAVNSHISRIVEFLDNRFTEVKKIGKYKANLWLPELDEERWKKVLGNRVAIAQTWDIKISKVVIEEVWNKIHNHALGIEGHECSIEGLFSLPSTLWQECFKISWHNKTCTITVRNVQSWSRFDSHFPGKPIVPWVALTSLLMGKDAYWSWLNTLTREFLRPVSPWDILSLEIVGIETQLVSTGKTNEVMVRFYERENTLKHGEEVIENPMKIENVKAGEELVPHGDNFRFIDKAWTLSSEEAWDALSSQALYGTYTLRERDQENGRIPWWILEESAAQMMLGAYRSYGWPGSEVMTYGKAETQVYSNEKLRALQPWDTLILKGRFIDKQKRTATWEYSIYVLNTEWKWDLLFSGRITGNLIPLKIWNR